MEIYNEAIYDLLAPPEKRTKLRIREDSSGNVYVKVSSSLAISYDSLNIVVIFSYNLLIYY